MKAFWPRLQTCWRSLDPFLPPSLLLSSRDSGINALYTKKRVSSLPPINRHIPLTSTS
ncbi:Hypothetical protein FKW44_017265 [Caligus rogercresseyi]|uniref:Uncharacterized protein n=1 Tax=Caligus rogercresseyi TaxID=217165 RepID=A0A7T8H335_CALRO|nr:Hypothetical protein FKW44_017265 [Caligus rogercresseyi]